MTDNEKRAHDIATSMLPTMYEHKLSNIASGSDNNVLDIMGIYENIYRSALRYFDHED